MRADRPTGRSRFDEVVELALYGAGRLLHGRAAAPGGGPTSSPAPRSARCSARSWPGPSTPWWDELGRPDPFVVVEAGAGRGTLAAPSSPPAGVRAGLRYVCVERSAGAAGGGGRAARRRRGGRRAARRARSPASSSPTSCSTTCPFRLLERTADGWLEVRVGRRRPGRGAGPGGARRRRAGRPLAPDAPVGARMPLQRAAAAWLRRRSALLGRGRVVVIDYADTTAVAGPPAVARLGAHLPRPRARRPPARRPRARQDITCEVAVDQLAPVRPPDADRSQAEFLAGPRPRRAGRRAPGPRGTSGPTSATSRPSGPAAGSARPTPSPTPPASAPSGSSSGTWADDGPARIRRRAADDADRRAAHDHGADAIEDLLPARTATFPPARRTSRPHGPGHRTPSLYERGRTRTSRRSGPARPRELLDWQQPTGTPSSSGSCPSPSGSSAARSTSRELPRPPRRRRPGRPGRLPLGGRAGRHPHHHLRRPARRGAALRQRAEGPRRRARATGSTSTCR